MEPGGHPRPGRSSSYALRARRGVSTTSAPARSTWAPCFGPDTGRFLGPDFYRGALGALELAKDPPSQNRYAFAGCNPISFVESTVRSEYTLVTDDGLRVVKDNLSDPDLFPRPLWEAPATIEWEPAPPPLPPLGHRSARRR